MSWHMDVFGGEEDDGVPFACEIDGRRYAAVALGGWALFTWQPEGKFDGLSLKADAVRSMLAVETPQEVSLVALQMELHRCTASHVIFGGRPYNHGAILSVLDTVAYSTEETTVRVGWTPMAGPKERDRDGQCLVIAGGGWRLHLQSMAESPPVFNFDAWGRG